MRTLKYPVCRIRIRTDPGFFPDPDLKPGSGSGSVWIRIFLKIRILVIKCINYIKIFFKILTLFLLLLSECEKQSKYLCFYFYKLFAVHRQNKQRHQWRENSDIDQQIILCIHARCTRSVNNASGILSLSGEFFFALSDTGTYYTTLLYLNMAARTDYSGHEKFSKRKKLVTVFFATIFTYF